METVKLSKFDWNRIGEQNSGHTKNEWGIQNEKTTQHKSYRVIYSSVGFGQVYKKILDTAGKKIQTKRFGPRQHLNDCLNHSICE